MEEQIHQDEPDNRAAADLDSSPSLAEIANNLQHLEAADLDDAQLQLPSRINITVSSLFDFTGSFWRDYQNAHAARSLGEELELYEMINTQVESHNGEPQLDEGSAAVLLS